MKENNIYAPPEANLESGKPVTDLASRWARLGGALIDSVVGLVLAAPFWYFTDFWERSLTNNVSTSETIFYTFIGIATFLLVNGYLMAYHGQTIGKRLAGTRMVSKETKKIIPFWKLVLFRFLPVNIVAVIPFLNILLLVDMMFIFRSDKRCLHDFIASTIVVKANAL